MQQSIDFTKHHGMEIWRDVVGFEGSYSVSNKGRVKSKKRIITYRSGKRKPVRERILSLAFNRGYRTVMLTTCEKPRKTKLVHRLVAEAFIPNPENKPHINHIDGNPSNNNIDNIEWCTRSENEIHKIHVLGRIGDITGLKEVYEAKKGIRIGNKYCYGAKMQAIFTDLMLGCAISHNKVRYGSLYAAIYDLRTRFKLPIKTRFKTLDGESTRFKEWYLEMDFIDNWKQSNK